MQTGSRTRRGFRVAVLGALLALAASALVPFAANANWLTKLAREAGEAGGSGAGKVGKLGLGTLDNAATHIRTLPDTARRVVLAAEATAEGHWRFVNRAGEVFTAGTPDEMGRIVQALAPDKAGDSRLALYLSEEAAFGPRAHLDALPRSAELHLVVDRQSYRLSRWRGDDGDKLHAVVRPNLLAELGVRSHFEEALWQLSRPLNRADIRVVALEPGGAHTLAGVPRRDSATGRAIVDTLDPDTLGNALGSVRGQTVLVTGRIEGSLLHFKPTNGPERTLVVSDLTAAAEAADVNLVILQSVSPRQPGGRNWLWQRIEVDGLDDALQRATFADFLNALGATRGRLAVTTQPDGPNRVVVQALPAGPPPEPVTGKVGEWTAEIVSQVTGNVVTNAIEAHTRSKERQQELDSRIVPGIPSLAQFAYLGALLAGVLGLPVALGWWRRLWPPERREEYAGRVGYHAARLARGLLMVLVFLPIVGLPALAVSLLGQLWAILTAPFRFAGWLLARITGRSRVA